MFLMKTIREINFAQSSTILHFRCYKELLAKIIIISFSSLLLAHLFMHELRLHRLVIWYFTAKARR